MGVTKNEGDIYIKFTGESFYDLRGEIQFTSENIINIYLQETNDISDIRIHCFKIRYEGLTSSPAHTHTLQTHTHVYVCCGGRKNGNKKVIL